MKRHLGGIVIALLLAGCAAGGGRAAAPPPSEPAPTRPSATATTNTPVSSPPIAAADPAPAVPRATGAESAPWDTAARSGATRRAHVYPRGESAIGKRLVDSLPDPGGLTPSEGGAAAAPAPATAAPATPTPRTPTDGECWEAQLLVTGEAARAERVRAEAGALLGVATRVEPSGGAFRVRAGGCLDSESARRLVERARAEGWPEAFRVQGTP
jgi:hypothetical protein